ncbi:hypothetical protein D3C87_1764040 [compost metagenome]
MRNQVLALSWSALWLHCISRVNPGKPTGASQCLKIASLASNGWMRRGRVTMKSVPVIIFSAAL